MGGYDVYCAVCGGPLGNIVSDERPDLYEDDEIYDRDILDPSKAAWLDRVRVMGENPDVASLSKAFVSGPATEQEAGFFSLEPSDDPNLPGGMQSAQAYNRDSDESLTIPFHEDCYELLQAKIGTKAFRKDVLYHTFASHVEGDYASVLKLDWGPLGELQDQYFVTRKGDEEYLLCPKDIPTLQEYYADLPRLHSPSRPSNESKWQQDSPASSDVFVALPAELLLLLMDRLPVRDMLSLKQASAAAHDIELTNRFWRGRISRDMPWLYDIPVESEQDSSVDWYTVYKDFHVASQRGHGKSLLALVNRRRIWETMDQIMNTYFTEWFRMQNNTPPVLEDAQAGHMALLVAPAQTDMKHSHALLLNDFHEIAHAQPCIRIHWTDEGIVGLSISKDGSEELIGNPELSQSSEEFILPVEDWVKEVTLTSKAVQSVRTSRYSNKGEERRFTGIAISFCQREPVQYGDVAADRRTLRPAPGNVVVGFMAEYSISGQISKLALLEQPRDKFPMDCTRITYATGSARDMAAEKLLWRTKIPSPRTRLSDLKKGYWGFSNRVDTLAMEKLVFAETEAEWKSITSVAGDMHMGGFRVEYSDREARTIGPRLNAMKSMSIDGAGGERVVCVIASVEHIIRGLRLLTNRGQLLAIGLSGPNQRFARYSASELHGRELTGIYCSWLDRTMPSSRLETFGVLSRDDHTYHADASSPAEALDDRGFVWEPTPLPTSLTETGRLYGEWSKTFQGRTENFPSVGSVVSYLDFSREISEVEIVSCHPQMQHRLNVVGVAVRYADGGGERVAVGYTELSPDLKEQEWCWCRLSGMTAEGEGAGPHCWSSSWKPVGQRITALRVHMDKHGALSGMQFVDGERAESPLWGYATHEGSRGEISFQGGEGPAVGVKFFLNDNDRAVTYNDDVVVAMQAVAKAG